MNKNVRVFRLVTGEEVLSELGEVKDTEYALINPVVINIMIGNNGMPQMSFMQFPMFSGKLNPSVKIDKSFDLPKSSVLYSYIPDEEILNNYNNTFGSGIIVPPKQLITG